MPAAALNLLSRRRRLAADPLELTGKDDPCPGDLVLVCDPTLAAEAPSGQERRRYHTYRRGKDPLG